jgi:hypothetical protein
MQIGDDYYEDLTPETTVKILKALAKGEKPRPGPQSGRQTSENSAGLTTCVGRLPVCSELDHGLTSHVFALDGQIDYQGERNSSHVMEN